MPEWKNRAAAHSPLAWPRRPHLRHRDRRADTADAV